VMQLAWRNLTTGLFFLLSVGILTAGLLIVGTNQNLFSQVYRLKIYLPDTQTLAKGTTVTLSGIEIGVIERISLDTYQGENAVRFDLRLKREYQHRITSSSKAIVKSIGVLGDKFLEITLGKAGEPPLADGAEIPCEPAVDYERLIKEVSNSFVSSLGRIESILDEVEAGRGTLGTLVRDSTLAERLTGSLDALETNLRALERREGTLGKLIYDPKLYDALAATSDRLASAAQKIDAGEGTLGRLIADSTLYVGAAGAATGMDSVMARINAGRGTVGKALSDSTAYEELHRAITDLRNLLQDMQANPGRYVKFSVF
jgi:phospholipid/cholesterol/gamma-HCH transport system substrate-binding protein